VSSGPSWRESLVYSEISRRESQTCTYQLIEDITTEVEEGGDMELSGGGIGSCGVTSDGEIAIDS